MHKLFVAIICLALFSSCKKDKPGEIPVSDSIFGEYYYNPPLTGSFWNDLFTGTLIKVIPVNTAYIKIINSDIGLLAFRENVFDSVIMLSPTTFRINQLIKDPSSTSGFSLATGTGNFGMKLVSYNILIERNGPIGNESIVMINARKTKD